MRILSRRGVLTGILSVSAVKVAEAGEAGRLYAQSKGYNQDQKDWLNEQKIPGSTGRCCNEADGEEVQEDIRGVDYWITGSKFPTWTKVPASAVINTPNKIGRPVVWWYQEEDMGGATYKIKCYAPGVKA